MNLEKPANASKAVPLLIKAAKGRSVLGMGLLADAYENGRGTDKDPAQAAYWHSQVDRILNATNDSRIPAPTTSPSSGERPSTNPVRRFSNHLADAPWLTGEQFMRNVGAVKLLVDASTEVALKLTDQEQEKLITDALRSYGIVVSDSSVPITLQVDLDYVPTEIQGVNADGEVVGRHLASAIDVNVYFTTTVPVLRDQGYRLMWVAVEWAGASGGWTGPQTAENLAKYLNEAVAYSLKLVATGSKNPDAAAAGWSAVTWDPQRTPEAERRYLMAMSEPASTSRNALKVVHDAPVLDFSLDGSADKYVTNSDLTRLWTGAVERGGFAGPRNPGLRLRDFVSVSRENSNNAAMALGLDIFENSDPYDRIGEDVQIVQRDVVFPLNGQLVRTDGVLWETHSMDISVPRETTAKLHEVISHNLAEFKRATSD